jgi:response regulator RpfG family c-di-GMP phosphodiesterase
LTSIEAPEPATEVAATHATILCVDDEPNILKSLTRLFRSSEFRVLTATGGADGIGLLERETVDVVVSDMRMPEMDGVQFLEQVQQRWPAVVRLLMTGYSDINAIIGAVNRGNIYRYITKPWDDHDIVLIVRQALEMKFLQQERARLEALTAAQNEELRLLNASLEAKVEQRTAELKVSNDSLQESNEKLKNNYVTLIKVFTALIEMRGGHLAGHSRRVADLCRRIAEKLKQERKFIHEVFIAGLMHEIGKVGFSDKLLLTPVSLLKSVQLDSYRRHILQAEQLLMPLQDLRGSCEMIGSQFERFDGQGFPEHIAGNVIPLGARILAVASDYDNLQTGTLAQRQLSPAEAKNRIVEGRGTRYDPAVVNALVELMGGVAQDDYRPRFGERRLLASELKMGMRLSRDLITPSGLLMLSTDHVMDQHLVDKIAAFEKSSDLHLTAWVRIELPT